MIWRGEGLTGGDGGSKNVLIKVLPVNLRKCTYGAIPKMDWKNKIYKVLMVWTSISDKGSLV